MDNWYKKSQNNIIKITLAKNEEQSYGWVYVTVPNNIAKKTLKFAKAIPKRELYTEDDKDWSFGVETEPHITVLWGIHTLDANELKIALEDMQGGKASLSKIDFFENDDYDVLKVNIRSPFMKKLNKKIKTHVTCKETFDYSPHLTLAYLKCGNGEKYKNKSIFNNISFDFDFVTFQDKNNKNTKINLN